MAAYAKQHLIVEGADDELAGSNAEEGLPLQAGGVGPRPRGSRVRLAVGAAFGVSLVAVAAVTLASQRRAPVSLIEDDLLELAEKKPKKVYRAEECSPAETVDCSTSKCCQDFGYTCFRKNATFSACLKKCDGTGGNCAALGEPTRCAADGENCLKFGCCAGVGNQCYAKNKYWGACMKGCNQTGMKLHDNLRQDWSCDVIGPRNTMDYRHDFVEPWVEVEPWVKNCSTIGENCASTKCCAWSGYKCYEQNDGWASCLRKCFPGKWNGGVQQMPPVQKGAPLSNPPAHWNATFKVAPPGPWTCKRLSVPPKYGYLSGTSLYCFTVALSENGSGKKIVELDIVKAAQEKKTHVFACDHWTVFSNVDMELNPGRTVKVYAPHTVHRPNTKNWVNLPLFLNVWKIIRQATTWKSFPWIVKSDPPAIFIPSRLRDILSRQRVTTNGVYLENCKSVRMSFHGSLEVISHQAWGTFMDHLEDCQRVLPWNNGVHSHFRYYGEDKFAAWCMHAYGVDKVPSMQQVESVPEDQPLQGLHISVSCPSHRNLMEMTIKNWLPNCTRAKTAGMFAFRTVDKYLKCLKETTEM